MEVLDAVGRLNAFVRDLHGPTDSIGQTMSRLVPFPTQVGSLPDADVLDLNLAVQAQPHGGAHVEAWARYATSARASQVRDFYRRELTRIGATIHVPAAPERADSHVVSAVLADAAQTRLRVIVDSSHGYRSVKVIVEYDNFDHRELFERFADWHSGSAPVTSGIAASGVEISTFAVGRGPNTVVLYSTDYACLQTSCEARVMVNNRIDELGWTYREPREGIMFIQDGQFDAETHVIGDDISSSITFVGEFQLR